ncbi:DegV family EDD domain-containing protein [Butyrivibrio sp. CB08]|uniref:DegV family protein n=1 Tax=Butyrivibrio sp. CB08 TaxID=2364879 RepID=UPI000EAA5E68|nr:DegV family protein [Butyrivibrio sp. CB08]RKM61297.1 DegV family EDD domain-containing protein [Butyrivibrio sp. CB08]
MKKLLKQIKQRYLNFIYDSSIHEKDRAFTIISACFILAVISAMLVGLFLHEPISSTVVSILVAIFGAALLLRVTKKGTYRRAKIIVALLVVFVFQPALFFTKGGIYCGDPFTLLLGTYFLLLVLEGRFRIIMTVINLVSLGVLYIIAYLRPELVTTYSRESDYVYSFAKYIITCLVLSTTTMFQARIYRKEAELSAQQTKELEELNKAQSRFFSSMSHEIRTPINTVLGLNEIILRQEDASEEIRKDARNIQGAGKMLLALINDILDVSKIEAGKMDIVPVNYSVSALLSEIVNMIWLKAEEKGLKFQVDIDPDVPETLFGDEVRIKQILINLLNNSVKYTKEGFISLHLECEYPEEDHVLLKITVTDSGMGIKAEALPHLFDTFQRVDEEKNRYIEGTGLGLSIVKQLVELMDGTITVNSVYTQGSAFQVTLKQGIASDKKIGEVNITGSGSLSESEKFEHSFHAPLARILIVDDNEMNLQVEDKLLQGTEMTVDLSISGEDALKKTLENRYDLIFMDHLMPEMDGIECYEMIRKQSGGLNQNVPIIVLTANAGGENLELYNNTGFDGYLVKPVSGRQLEDMLISHLPAEKVILAGSNEVTGASINTASSYARKKPVVIAASSMTDLPQSIIKELQISIIPFTVITKEGVFWDNIDIDSDELLRYMGDENRFSSSDSPSEHEFVQFFSKELKKAHHLIYITLSSNISEEHRRASRAAATFENVTIFNSECLSSSTGSLTMIAARLAGQNLPVDKILQELEIAKKHIRCSFVIRNTEVMARRGYISPFINGVLNTLWLRPVLVLKNDRMTVGRFFMGSDQSCYMKYIQKTLSSKANPDTEFAFITYAGMKEEDLLWIEKAVRERCSFEHIIFQKASAGISSNCGAGTFGILFLEKGDHSYNLSQVLPKDEEAEAVEEVTTEEPVAEPEETVKEPEKKWYELLPSVDAKTGIGYSGSEDAYLSLLKIYHDSYDVKAGEIESFFEAENFKDYTIKVHALKSSSRLIGATSLGEEAQALENAGKEENTEYIKEHHRTVMKHYKEIVDAIAPNFAADKDLPEIDDNTLEEAYGALNEFTQARDYECVRMVLDSVKDFKLPTEDEGRFKRISDSLLKMDFDEIAATLSERS